MGSEEGGHARAVEGEGARGRGRGRAQAREGVRQWWRERVCAGSGQGRVRAWG